MKRTVLVGMAILAAGCGDDPVGPGPMVEGDVASLELTPGTVQFGAVGSSSALAAVARDANGRLVPGTALVWSVAGSGVVMVSDSGVVTSTGNGTDTVRVTSGSAQALAVVTVEQSAASIDLDPATFDRVGETVALAGAVADSNGNAVEGTDLAFASSDPSTVHVAADGRVTANYPGFAEITVSGAGLSATATFTVSVAGARLGEAVPCAGGTAAGFPCAGVELVSYLPLGALGVSDAGAARLNDMWGWTDPADGKEYALVARTDGVTFVDVTDALRPRALGYLPSPTPASSWRDVKVYANHAYVVADGAAGHGVQIFDLTRLRGVDVFTTFSEDGRYTGVSSVHNIAIDEATGFAYAVGSNGGGNTCGGGLHMLDLSSPLSPAFAGCFADDNTGRAGSGYTHDVQCVVYAGPDATYAGREICVGSNETAISIADVTDKNAAVALSTGTYPDARYVHQGWLTEDHRYFIQNDELDELEGVAPFTRMLVWDVTDLDDPILVAEHPGPTGAIDHNVYIRDGIAYQSNYQFGIRFVDLSTPASPVEAGFFDTYPENDARGFSGSWSNYPFFDSGIVVVTSAEEGLFVLRRP